MKPALPSTLLQKLRQLRLRAVADGLESLAESDAERAASAVLALEPLVDAELDARIERTIKRRIEQARFIRIQTVDTFNFDYNQSTRKIRRRYLNLLAADPVAQRVGALFVGNSGLGKTHLARALGYAACQRAHRVLYLPCSTLLNQLVAAESTRDLAREIKKLESPALLIVDELAYITMSHQEANLFFQVVSRRHDRERPTAITTNKRFAEWNQVFHGDATAHAILDRLTERAEIFYVEGKSYRSTHRTGITLDPSPAKR